MITNKKISVSTEIDCVLMVVLGVATQSIFSKYQDELTSHNANDVAVMLSLLSQIWANYTESGKLLGAKRIKPMTLDYLIDRIMIGVAATVVSCRGNARIKKRDDIINIKQISGFQSIV